MKTSIVLVGGRIDGHAGVVLDAIEEDGSLEVQHIFEGLRPDGESIAGIENLGNIENWKDFEALPEYFHIAAGDNLYRRRIESFLKSHNKKLITIRHPGALISRKCKIGSGAFLAMGSRVANNAEVGVCTILNTNATVEHDCKVANFVHMAPSSTITGRVVIGECSFIGVGAVIYPDVRIPRESFIGGGAIVRKTLSEKGTLYGYDSMPTFRNIYDRKLT